MKITNAAILFIATISSNAQAKIDSIGSEEETSRELISHGRPCPRPPQGMMFPTIHDPVTCTNNRSGQVCEYPSLAKAQAAVGRRWQCESTDTCPEVPSGIMIPYINDPQICSDWDNFGCEYPNFEAARAAGFRRRHCESAVPTNTCPEVPSGIMIPYIDDPQICSDWDNFDCEYPNWPSARAAGFLRQQCESVVPPNTCPEVPRGMNIVGNHDPQICSRPGSVDCEYGNWPSARAAGFARRQCESSSPPNNCPVPRNDGTFGITISDPVRCINFHNRNDSLECVYDNRSLARQAGFRSMMDCVSVNNCPESWGPSDRSFRPVRCIDPNDGTLLCDYNNLSLAQGAGFSSNDCINKPN